MSERKQYALVTGKDQGLAAELVAQLQHINFKPTKYPYEVDLVDVSMMDENWKPERNYDVVINCWGINHLSWIGETDKKDAAILIDNVLKPYWIVNQLVKHGNKPARIINVSSQTYRVAQRTTSLYCASKAALVQMTKVMARELAPHGWVVNAYAPGKILGTVMSEMTDKQVEELRGWTKEQAEDYATKNIPVGRFMTLKEAAWNCLQILNFSPYVNGTTIEAMGGI